MTQNNQSGDNMRKDFLMIPVKERKELRSKMIRRLYNRGRGLTMNAIVELSKENPRIFYGTTGVSKTTVFFAVNGRSPKISSHKNKRSN